LVKDSSIDYLKTGHLTMLRQLWSSHLLLNFMMEEYPDSFVEIYTTLAELIYRLRSDSAPEPGSMDAIWLDFFLATLMNELKDHDINLAGATVGEIADTILSWTVVDTQLMRYFQLGSACLIYQTLSASALDGMNFSAGARLEEIASVAGLLCPTGEGGLGGSGAAQTCSRGPTNPFGPQQGFELPDINDLQLQIQNRFDCSMGIVSAASDALQDCMQSPSVIAATSSTGIIHKPTKEEARDRSMAYRDAGDAVLKRYADSTGASYSKEDFQISFDSSSSSYVNVVYSSIAVGLNCPPGAGGCFNPAFPNTNFVDDSALNLEDAAQLVAHETGHLIPDLLT